MQVCSSGGVIPKPGHEPMVHTLYNIILIACRSLLQVRSPALLSQIAKVVRFLQMTSRQSSGCVTMHSISMVFIRSRSVRLIQASAEQHLPHQLRVTCIG
jgi:hypothetical protein